MKSNLYSKQGVIPHSPTNNQAVHDKNSIQGKATISTRSKKSLKSHKNGSAKTISQCNKLTQWAYLMQSIEPSSKAINEAFPDYHPMWVVQSQKFNLTAIQFKFMREFMLNISVEQCAAYMRVARSTVTRWESGKTNIPFVAFELLRLVFESAHFRLSHKDWQGWFINQDGRLVSPDRGNLSFSSNELAFIREVHQMKSMYESENKQLRAELLSMRLELAALKNEDGNDAVLDELRAIEAKLSELTTRVTNKKISSIHAKTKPLETTLEVQAA